MSIVTVKVRTIVVYRDDRGRQLQTKPMLRSEAQRMVDGPFFVGQVLYLVRCRPRKFHQIEAWNRS